MSSFVFKPGDRVRLTVTAHIYYGGVPGWGPWSQGEGKGSPALFFSRGTAPTSQAPIHAPTTFNGITARQGIVGI